MATYVYTKNKTEGLPLLLSLLDAKLLPRFDGLNFWRKGEVVELGPKDAIVCWGDYLPSCLAARVLNASADLTSDVELNKQLRKFGIGMQPTKFESIESYTKAVAEGPKRYRQDALMPCKHLPGYGLYYIESCVPYRFHIANGKILLGGKGKVNKRDESIVFTDNIGLLSNNIVEKVLNVVQKATLDFGMLCMLDWKGHGEDTYLRKIVTNPVLTMELAQLYAGAISEMLLQKPAPVVAEAPNPIDF